VSLNRRSDYEGGEARVQTNASYRKVSRDPVTGLLNPHALLAILDYALERGVRAETDTTLLFIWLPDPTRELVGDERLFQLVARFLRKMLRGEDATGRIGNGFLVLLPDTGPEGAEVVARRISDGLWNNLGLAIAGRWAVHIDVSTPEDDGREFITRATAAVPGLAAASLPREHRPLLRSRSSRRQ
jgi:diguanylate cyclase (GGDEF)-like protein